MGVQVLYIGGLVRSGSTLLERLLGELPGVCALGEVIRLWERAGRHDVRCGCGSWFGTCEFWAAVGEQAFGGWENVDRDRVAALWRRVGRVRHAVRRIGPVPTSNHRAEVDEYTDYYVRVYAAAAAVSGARVVIDSSKYPGLVLCLGCRRDVDLSVLHLIRDPRGVAYSLAKHVPNPDRQDGAQGRLSPVAAALQWLGGNAAMELLPVVGRSGPGAGAAPASKRIRYEDLLADPAGTVREVAELAGLRIGADDLSFLRSERADLGVIHSCGGNRMRFDRGAVSLRHDDAWRGALPVRHRVLVSALCTPLLASYGYPARGR